MDAAENHFMMYDVGIRHEDLYIQRQCSPCASDIHVMMLLLLYRSHNTAMTPLEQPKISLEVFVGGKTCRKLIEKIPVLVVSSLIVVEIICK